MQMQFGKLIAHAAQQSGQCSWSEIIGNRQMQISGQLGVLHVAKRRVTKCQQFVGMTNKAFASRCQLCAGFAPVK